MGEKGQKDSKKAPAELKQSTPLQLKGKTSKNQRTGEKQIHAPRLCYKGHNIVDVMFMPVIGRAKMMYVCECNYAPINTSTPYQTRKDSGVPGKKRDAVKSKGSTNVYFGG